MAQILQDHLQGQGRRAHVGKTCAPAHVILLPQQPCVQFVFEF